MIRQYHRGFVQNPGCVVTTFQVAELFGKAFIRAATMQTAINGFKKCGIWPFDSTVFTEVDFIASMTTDIPLNERTDLGSNINIQSEAAEPEPMQSPIEQTTDQMTDSQPGCSYWPDRQNKTPEPNNDTSFLFTSPQELIPVPVAQQKSRGIEKTWGELKL